MSRDKQIEEMAKVLIDYTKKNHIMASTAILTDYVEKLYTAGYRKQRKIIRCKDCEHSCQVGDVRICRHWNYHSTKDDAYCSFAKMKGGE